MNDETADDGRSDLGTLDTVDLAVLSIEELKEMAKTHGISGYNGQRKRRELVGLLRESGVGRRSGQCALSSTASDSSVGTLGGIMSELKGLAQKLEIISDLQREVRFLQDEVARLKQHSPPVDHSSTHLPTHSPYNHEPCTEKLQPVQVRHHPYPADTASKGGDDETYQHVVADGKVRDTGNSPHQAAQTKNSYSSTLKRSLPPKPGSTRVVSYFHRKPERQSDRLTAGNRVRCCALYVGNIDSSSSAEAIVKWCMHRKVDVIKCSVSATRFFGLSYAHVVIPDTFKEQALETAFWPDKVTAREWKFGTDKLAHGSNQ